MPEVPINYIAVVAAAAASMAVGFVWYGRLFGKQWQALSGLSPDKIAAVKGHGMGSQYAWAALGSLVMSYVLAHALAFASFYTGIDGVAAGLQVGFWNWLGFVAPVTHGLVLWEGKSWKLWMLNNGYYLISLLAMGVILAVWP